MSVIEIVIQDKAAQSINSFPRPVVGIETLDRTDQYYFDSSTYIRVIAPDIDQTLIQFTNGTMGAMMPDHTEFPEDRSNETEIDIVTVGLYPKINYVSFFIETTGEEASESEEAPAEETHEIKGSVTKDSKVIVLDTVTSELIKAQNVSTGLYTISLPSGAVDVLAKTLTDGEPLAHTNVEPVEKTT